MSAGCLRSKVLRSNRLLRTQHLLYSNVSVCQWQCQQHKCWYSANSSLANVSKPISTAIVHQITPKMPYSRISVANELMTIHEQPEYNADIIHLRNELAIFKKNEHVLDYLPHRNDYSDDVYISIDSIIDAGPKWLLINKPACLSLESNVNTTTNTHTHTDTGTDTTTHIRAHQNTVKHKLWKFLTRKENGFILKQLKITREWLLHEHNRNKLYFPYPIQEGISGVLLVTFDHELFEFFKWQQPSPHPHPQPHQHAEDGSRGRLRRGLLRNKARLSQTPKPSLMQETSLVIVSEIEKQSKYQLSFFNQDENAASPQPRGGRGRMDRNRQNTSYSSNGGRNKVDFKHAQDFEWSFNSSMDWSSFYAGLTPMKSNYANVEGHPIAERLDVYTDWRCVATDDKHEGYALLQFKYDRRVQHQVQRLCALNKTPVIGDLRYQSPESMMVDMQPFWTKYGNQRIGIHIGQLSFLCPSAANIQKWKDEKAMHSAESNASESESVSTAPPNKDGMMAEKKTDTKKRHPNILSLHQKPITKTYSAPLPREFVNLFRVGLQFRKSRFNIDCDLTA